MHAHVRLDGRPDDHRAVGGLAPALAAAGSPTCPECGSTILTKRPASVCSARCRAAASRRRRQEADLARLTAAEAALVAALGVVGELRGDLARRAGS
jgi:predicted nucleic acid-binding Zn ribbon protein